MIEAPLGCRTCAALALAAGLLALAGCGGDSSGTTSTGAGPGGGLSGFIAADHARADSDGDGFVAGKEADAAIRRDFEATDLNGDGVITIADVKADIGDKGAPRRALSYYMPQDVNADGRITEAEYVTAVRRQVFAPMDGDGDGKISRAEAVDWHRDSGGSK